MSDLTGYTIEKGAPPDGPHLYAWKLWRDGRAEWEYVYIGKHEYGGFKRALSHERAATNGSRYRWHRALKEYLNRGARLRVECLSEHPRDELNDAEQAAIKLFGRRDIDPGGTLWNEAEGGDGMTVADAERYANDPEWRAKVGEANRRLAADPEWLRKNAVACQRRSLSPEYRAMMAENTGQTWADPVIAARRSRNNIPYIVDGNEYASLHKGQQGKTSGGLRNLRTKLNRIFEETGQRPVVTIKGDWGQDITIQRGLAPGEVDGVPNGGLSMPGCEAANDDRGPQVEAAE